MPVIRQLSLVCRACGAPVHMPEPPAETVTCGGCGAGLGSVADLGLQRSAPLLSGGLRQRIRALVGA